jgi:4-amino-4-deoxy-L-arabinose transferase-like glycosyltransferase
VVAVSKGVVNFEFNPDTLDYLSFAHNLATGVGFAHSVDEQQPFSLPVEFSAWRPPLYPAVLAIVFQFSHSLLVLRLLQVGFAGLSIYFFLHLGFILFGELAALLAGLIFACYPPLIMYSADLGTESLFLLLLIAVFFVFYAGKEHSASRFFLLGILVGLAALCRPNGLMLAPALALAFYVTDRGWRRPAYRIVALAAGVAITILPWTYRNYRLFHRFVPISTNGGVNFWEGAHFRLERGATLTDIVFLHMLDSVPEPQRHALEPLSEPEREQWFYRKGFAILNHNPGRLATMVWRNFAAMFAFVPSSQYHSLRNRLIYSFSYIPVLVFGLAGFWTAHRRWRELSPFWGWLLANTTLYCLFLSAIRYRIATVDPILILATGVSLAALLGRRSTGELDPTSDAMRQSAIN